MPLLSERDREHDPQKLRKKKKPEVTRVQIGHEDDPRYEKYEKSKKNQIKIKSYKSYLKYTPTFASSENNQFSHYFGDGPL